MRTGLLSIFAFAVVLAGCESSTPPPLTPAQKADIGQEVLQQVHQDIRVWETLAVDETMKGMEESPDFALVMPDGNSYDYAQFRKAWADMAASGKAEKITPRSERVIVLAPDLALYTFQATLELFMKDGSEARYDQAAATYLYRKVGDRWMLAYGHESANPPTRVPPPGAATAPAPPPPKRSMAEMQQAYLDAFVADVHDAAKLAALYAPDAVIAAPGSPDVKGRDAIVGAYRGMIDAYTNLAIKPVRTWSKGNVLVVEAVLAGTDKASGKPVGVDYLTVLTFGDDGLVAVAHSYVDVVTLMKQTGAFKDKVPGRAVLSLPTAPPEAHVARGDAAEDANVARVNALNAAWLKLDEKAVLGFFADDVVTHDFWTDQPHDKKWIKEDMVAGRKASKDPTWKDRTLVGVEDFTIDEGESSFTQTGDFVHGPIHFPNQKKTITGHSVEVDQWKDGKIVQSWTWANEMEIDAQLGTGPAAPKTRQR